VEVWSRVCWGGNLVRVIHDEIEEQNGNYGYEEDRSAELSEVKVTRMFGRGKRIYMEMPTPQIRVVGVLERKNIKRNQN
jgi:hypothetical protein